MILKEVRTHAKEKKKCERPDKKNMNKNLHYLFFFIKKVPAKDLNLQFEVPNFEDQICISIRINNLSLLGRSNNL